MTDELRVRLLVAIGGGATIDRLAELADVQPRTVKRWLAAGRKEHDGEYGTLAWAFDSAPEPAAVGAGPLTEDDVVRLLERAARRGSVPAMKVLLERFDAASRKRPPAPVSDPLAEFDELAARRRVRLPSLPTG